MWLTLMPCGCRSGGGLNRAPIGPKRAKKKCVPTTFLKTAVRYVQPRSAIVVRSIIKVDLYIAQMTHFGTVGVPGLVDGRPV